MQRFCIKMWIFILNSTIIPNSNFFESPITQLSDFSCSYVYKQLAKSTKVRACQNFSRPPEHPLGPQRVKDDGTCRDSCFLCPLFTNFEHFFVDVTHHCVRLWRRCFARRVMIGDVLPRWRLMGLYSHPLLTIIHRASVVQEAERDVACSHNNTELNLRKGFQTFRSIEAKYDRLQLFHRL